MALLLKGNETRGWATRYRGPLAIHAAKRWNLDQQHFGQVEHTLGRLPSKLPLGAVVAVAWLVDCRPAMEILPTINPIEKLYGDYGPGRYAWLLKDVQALTEPVPFIGRQGFFEVPQALIAPRAPGWFGKVAA